jgi:nitrogen regulatory protein P-II 2
MKQLSVVVKPFRAEAVLKVLEDLGVDSWFVREAKGYSRQKGYLDRYLGGEYSMAFLPKVEIVALVDDQEVEKVSEAVVKIARTGRIGDGKVFVIPVPPGLELSF